MSELTLTSFNTHKYIKKLMIAGFTESQAEALADEQLEIIEKQNRFVIDKFATKQDLIDLKKDIHRDLKELELRMTIKLGTISVVVMGIFTTIIKFVLT